MAEINPTDIDCNGTMFDFDLTRQLSTELIPGETFNSVYFYNTGIVDNAFVDVALNVFVGDTINSYLANCCFEFSFADAWGRGNASSWGSDGNWGEYKREILPLMTTLDRNYPNPFNSSTTILFTTGSSGHVNLSIYNIAGQLVETLYNGQLIAGHHSIVWDASATASGVYFYKLTVDHLSTTKKMELVK
jgi:hypothetical protein